MNLFDYQLNAIKQQVYPDYVEAWNLWFQKPEGWDK